MIVYVIPRRPDPRSMRDYHYACLRGEKAYKWLRAWRLDADGGEHQNHQLLMPGPDGGGPTAYAVGGRPIIMDCGAWFWPLDYDTWPANGLYHFRWLGYP